MQFTASSQKFSVFAVFHGKVCNINRWISKDIKTIFYNFINFVLSAKKVVLGMTLNRLAHSAGAAEYTDRISAKE